MDDIRNALLKGDGNKLTKKQYKFAVKLERSRLLQQLVFLTFVSALIAAILFISLYFDIAKPKSTWESVEKTREEELEKPSKNKYLKSAKWPERP